jgi:N-methylhydantoinase A
MASVLSAFGALVTPARLDLVRGALSRLDAIDWDQAGRLLDEMEAEGRKALSDAGIDSGDIRFRYGADMRYYGQANEVTVALDRDPRRSRDVSAFRASFERAYEALYGLKLSDMDVEMVSWRTSAHGPPRSREHRGTLASTPGRPREERPVLFETGSRAVPVFERGALAAGQELDGPALVEERETTLVLRPSWRAKVLAHGGIVATYHS